MFPASGFDYNPQMALKVAFLWDGRVPYKSFVLKIFLQANWGAYQ